MHSGCDAGVAAEEGDRKIAEESLLHFQTMCEGEARRMGRARRRLHGSRPMPHMIFSFAQDDEWRLGRWSMVKG